MTLDQLPTGPAGETAKAFGAYYTDPAVARFVVGWALRSASDTVADPAFGGGVFLAAASERLQQLGGSPSQIFGVELDAEVHEQTARALAAHFSVCQEHLFRRDFFELEPTDLRLDAVVGNPPFIRFQRFSGQARERAARRAAEQGVRLGRLASSWAAFVVHSAAFLRPGGRLGLVVPAELGHAAYARPLLAYLCRAFERVRLLSFREKLFPALSQDVLILLAEGLQAEPREQNGVFELLDLGGTSDLQTLELPWTRARRLDGQALAAGCEHLQGYLLPPHTHGLYRHLACAKETFRLGEVARVGTGYVTGHNAFFHLSPARAQGIPARFLKPSVWAAQALRGISFTEVDWDEARQRGQAGFLLHIEAGAALPPALQAYLEQGQHRGIHQAYKCRVRTPWYAIPQVQRPDAFLTYMSGEGPRLVVNEAGAVAPNSLHLVRTGSGLQARALAVLWQTSLARLSAELEGHPMGGGMLKLEPGEAERVLLPRLEAEKLAPLADELKVLMQKGRLREAQSLADQRVLREGLGLSEKEVAALRDGADYLRLRRQRRLAGL